MPRCSRAAISFAPRPRSPRISRVCSPGRGGWRRRPGSVAGELDRQVWQAGAGAVRHQHVEQTAACQQMRVLDQVRGLRHGGCPPARRSRPARPSPLGEDALDLGISQGRASTRSALLARRGSFRRSGRPNASQNAEMDVAGDAEEQQLALGGLERLVDRPGVAARRHRRRLLAGHRLPPHVLGRPRTRAIRTARF
jgi:hypothetical protein